MRIIGIDLSMRSTGLTYKNEDELEFDSINPSAKTYNDEALLSYNAKMVCNFIDKYVPDVIVLEGLSHNSISSSKDLIAGNFWHVRIAIKERYLLVPLYIVPVKSWREPLFSKEERKIIAQCTKELKELKKLMKGCNKAERNDLTLQNESIILGSDIKYQTYLKLPEEIRERLKDNSAKYDITDSYFIAKHVEGLL